MNDDQSLRERVASAAQASRDIWRHLEKLTAAAFAAAEQQKLIEETRANARKRELGLTHGWPRVAAA
jgi:hypothetical protein